MSTLSVPQPTWSPLPKAFSPEDLLSMDGLFELVDGELVEKYMSVLAGRVAAKLIILLGTHVEAHQLGDVLPEVTFKCFPRKPDQVRRPDIAFFTRDRARDLPDEGHVLIPPDLAIEVVSPNDVVYELDDKLADYESANISIVWVLNPQQRTVRVIHPRLPTITLHPNDELSGEAVVPGFKVLVSKLFPQK